MFLLIFLKDSATVKAPILDQGPLMTNRVCTAHKKTMMTLHIAVELKHRHRPQAGSFHNGHPKRSSHPLGWEEGGEGDVVVNLHSPFGDQIFLVWQQVELQLVQVGDEGIVYL